MVAMLLCCQASLWADAIAEEMPAREQGLWQTLTMVAIAMAFFYFVLWRPEQKRRKVMEEQRSALKKGDRVTAMGVIGTIVRVQENTVILKMYDGSKLEFLKGAITEVLPEESAQQEENAKDETREK